MILVALATTISMDIYTSSNAEQLGIRAASNGAAILRQSLEDWGNARLILATGASQFSVLASLLQEPDIAWNRVTLFHLDEYLGLPPTHPASFRKYLWERFVSNLPIPLSAVHWIDGEADPRNECTRLNQSIGEGNVDLAFVGIGENGHLAFNDPPADFDTDEPYITVTLDEACRRQQLGEGWFPSLEAVPTRAISMSIKQIMKSQHIVCSVPDLRKAKAVRDCVDGAVSNLVPASILQKHPNCKLFLDQESASLLNSQR